MSLTETSELAPGTRVMLQVERAAEIRPWVCPCGCDQTSALCHAIRAVAEMVMTISASRPSDYAWCGECKHTHCLSLGPEFIRLEFDTPFFVGGRYVDGIALPVEVVAPIPAGELKVAERNYSDGP